MGTSETRRKGRSGADLSQLILVSERAKSAAEASASTAIGHLLPPPPQQLPSRWLFLGACLLRVGGQAKERLVPDSSLPCFLGNGHLLQNGVTRVGWRSFQNRGERRDAPLLIWLRGGNAARMTFRGWLRGGSSECSEPTRTRCSRVSIKRSSTRGSAYRSQSRAPCSCGSLSSAIGWCAVATIVSLCWSTNGNNKKKDITLLVWVVEF